MRRETISLVRIRITNDVRYRNLTNSSTIYALIAAIVILILVIYNLPNQPPTWFDEGSHLHVPKSLVQFGVYADYSSEGFRYFGPTIGVGPTVMLPIAAAIKVFGIGLLQARLVMAFYLLATITVFYGLVRNLGDRKLAWLALILLISTRSVLFLQTGRQVLGEVPGLFFLLGATWIWFTSWGRTSWSRLIVVGLFFGLAAITKYQYLLFLIPTLGLAWFLNLVYYRIVPQRTFIIPALVSTLSFGIWSGYMIAYLGPATATENFALLRESIAGAALILSPSVMARSLETLTSRAAYLGALFPALVYGATLAIPRESQGQKWGLIFILMATNLTWFVLASIGWLRYAFLGLAIASLFVARFFIDLTDGFRLGDNRFLASLTRGQLTNRRYLLNLTLTLWLVVMIVVPLAKSVAELYSETYNPAEAMASYLNDTVPPDVTIETWEPEMGFLTDHSYHFPPNQLLYKANAQIYLDGEPVSGYYDYLQNEAPKYILLGNFSRWVQLYPENVLAEEYQLLRSIDDYQLYWRID